MTSPIEDLFHEIYGFRPKKEGEAYEKLSAAVLKLLFHDNKVYHDERLRGIFSKTLFQLDVRLMKGEQEVMGEAKDYSEAGRKVGRPDLQKLAGALADLEVSEGMFFSATDYTRPAIKYAKASNEIIQKPIDLYHLRPTVEKDEEGRIKKIIINITICEPKLAQADYLPEITQEGQRALNELSKELIKNGKIGEDKKVSVSIDKFYDNKGDLLVTISDLSPYITANYPMEETYASWLLPGAHVLLFGNLIPIYGITFKVPFHYITEQIIVEAKGAATLLIKDEKGEINKIITDVDLKKVKFASNGEVILT